MDYQVAVVGGGPAGSTAAYLLAQRGINVVIFDEEKMPRRKPCGGALSQRCLLFLEELGLSLPKPLIERTVTGLHIVQPDGTCTIIDLQRPIAHLILREHFDHFLFKKAIQAGAEAREQVKITGVIKKKTKIILKTINDERYEVDMILGADGATGSIARIMGIRPSWPPEQIRSVVEMEPQVDANELSKAYPSNLLYFWFGSYPLGYSWVFPKKQHISIGLGGLSNKVKNLKQHLREFASSLPLPIPSSAKIMGGLIPVGGIHRPITTDRTLLLGDAAGLVDPFSEEGIYHALKSGTIASNMVDSALTTGKTNHEALLQYEHECWKQIGEDLKASLRFAQGLHSRPNFYISLIVVDRKTQHEFLKIQEGTNTYQKFLRDALRRAPLLVLKYLASRFKP